MTTTVAAGPFVGVVAACLVGVGRKKAKPIHRKIINSTNRGKNRDEEFRRELRIVSNFFFLLLLRLRMDVCRCLCTDSFFFFCEKRDFICNVNNNACV